MRDTEYNIILLYYSNTSNRELDIMFRFFRLIKNKSIIFKTVPFLGKSF